MPESVLSRLARSTCCQRPNRLPPERRAFSSRRTRYKSESGCPRNPTNISSAAKPCQSAHPTEFPPDFHIGKTGAGRRLGSLSARKQHAQRYGLPLREAPDSAHGFFGHARAEDRKLRKDPTFGGPCFEGTLQKPTGVSESSPVAGTT